MFYKSHFAFFKCVWSRIFKYQKLLNDALETFHAIIISRSASGIRRINSRVSFFFSIDSTIVESANVKWRTSDVKALNFQCGERRFFFFREGEPVPLCIPSPKKSSRLWQRGWNNARVWAARAGSIFQRGLSKTFRRSHSIKWLGNFRRNGGKGREENGEAIGQRPLQVVPPSRQNDLLGRKTVRMLAFRGKLKHDSKWSQIL